MIEELDESWAEMLIAASERADIHGRGDVAEYLRVKATNDAIRAAGVKWLLDAFIAAAFESAYSAQLTIEREDGHTFAHGASTMAGTRLHIRYGVRCLTVEAGWTRLPAHGIMRGAALARANVLHFGRGRDNAALKLTQIDELPQWFADGGPTFVLDDIRQHVSRLVGD